MSKNRGPFLNDMETKNIESVKKFLTDYNEWKEVDPGIISGISAFAMNNEANRVYSK